MENLKIKQKTEDMIKYGYIALRQFPKSEKFSLAQDIKRTMFAMLEQIIRANRSRDKRAMLYSIDTELEILRTQMRLAMELQFLPFSKYETWSGHLHRLVRCSDRSDLDITTPSRYKPRIHHQAPFRPARKGAFSLKPFK